jgi:hypothetical protein
MLLLLAQGCGGKVMVVPASGGTRDAEPPDIAPILDASLDAEARPAKCQREPRFWHDPAPVLALAGEHAANPKVAINPSGEATAVWQQYGASDYGDSIFASRLPASGGAWSPEVRIEGRRPNAETPDVVMDDAGDAVVVWQQYRDFAGDRAVYANRYVARTGEWGTDVLVAVTGTDSMLDPKVGASAAGDAAAAWLEFHDLHHSIHGSAFDAASGSWSAPSLVANIASGSPAYPHVAADRAGNAIAAWLDADVFGGTAYARRYRASSRTLDPTATLGAGGNSSSLVDVAIAPSGDAVVAWVQRDDALGQIWLSRYVASSDAWTVAGPVPDSLGASLFATTMDGQGNAVIVWRRQDAGEADIGATAFGRSAVIAGSAGDPLFPRVAADGVGNAIAVWQQHYGGVTGIQSSRYDAATGEWTAAERLDPGPWYADEIEMAMAPCGRAVVVWTQQDEDGRSVWSRLYDP